MHSSHWRDVKKLLCRKFISISILSSLKSVNLAALVFFSYALPTVAIQKTERNRRTELISLSVPTWCFFFSNLIHKSVLAVPNVWLRVKWSLDVFVVYFYVNLVKCRTVTYDSLDDKSKRARKEWKWRKKEKKDRKMCEKRK